MNKKGLSYYWKQLAKFLSKEMQNSESEEFKNWASAYDNKKLANEVEKNFKQIEEVKTYYDQETNHAWNKLKERIEAGEDQGTTKQIRLNSMLRYAAAFILAAAMVSAFAFLIQNKDQSNLLVAETELNQDRIVLQDGSIVDLNGNSKLIYPEKFGEHERRVKLIGEAFFSISKNPEKPFIIEANEGEVSVLGTSFNVLAPKTNKRFLEVYVESGKVSLKNEATMNKELILEKGDFGRINKNRIENAAQNNPNYLSWKTKKLVFNNTKLNEVVYALERTYACEIDARFSNKSMYELTSTFDNASLETVITSICRALNLTYEIKKGEIILREK